MANMIGCVKAKFGVHDYYVASMSGAKLVQLCQTQRELEDVLDEPLTVEEKFNRTPNYQRVANEICRYLKEDPKRFFGPLVMGIWAQDLEGAINFEPLTELQGIPELYRQSFSQFGTLFLDEAVNLVPYDGQHRLLAIKAAIDGRHPDPSKAIEIPYQNRDLETDEISVVLIPFETDSARNIFTKINKQAKPVSAADKIQLDDNDSAAVLAREISDEFFDSNIVRLNTSLPARANEFITLDTMYKAAKNIIAEEVPGWKNLTANLTRILDDDNLAVCRSQLKDIFQKFTNLRIVSSAISNPSSDEGKENRINLRANNLLGKPAFLHCLFEAWITVRKDEGATDQVIANKIEQMDFSYDVDGVWNNLIFLGEDKKMQTKPEDKKITTEVFKHLLGHQFGGIQGDINWMERTYASRKRTIQRDSTLPNPI